MQCLQTSTSTVPALSVYELHVNTPSPYFLWSRASVVTVCNICTYFTIIITAATTHCLSIYVRIQGPFHHFFRFEIVTRIIPPHPHHPQEPPPPPPPPTFHINQPALCCVLGISYRKQSIDWYTNHFQRPLNPVFHNDASHKSTAVHCFAKTLFFVSNGYQ